MLPTTNIAIALMLAGAALLLLGAKEPGAGRRWPGLAAAMMVLLVGALTLSEHVFHYNLGIDQLLAAEPAGAIGVTSPNRMGLPAAVCLTLLGAGLLALYGRRRTIAPFLGAAVCLITLVSLVGYFYGLRAFYRLPSFTAIAWPTAAGLMALGLGLVLAHADSEPLAMLLRKDVGGTLLCRLAPLVIVVPLVMGFLCVLGERHGLYSSTFGCGVLVIVLVVLILAGLWLTAMRLSRSAAQQARGQQHLAHVASFPELNPNPIFETDLEGNITYANPSAQKLFPNLLECGASHPLLAGWDAVIAGRTEGPERVVERELEVGERVFQQTIYYTLDPRQIRTYFNDITERKLAEAALIRHEKLVSMGRMAATIAHEINNPLAAVTNSVFLAMTAENLPPAAREYLETAEEELRRVAYIAHQTLGFYRETTAPARTPVTGVLDSAIDLLKSRIKAKQAVIEKQWEGEWQVMGVASELRQVFANLLANSLDAIEEKGVIKLHVSAAASFADGRRGVRITVADNGAGISATSRQHMFEAFFTTKDVVGTGLGLWVSRQIIEKHGGAIRLRSNAESSRRGTVFSVVLPIETEAAHSQAAGT